MSKHKITGKSPTFIVVDDITEPDIFTVEKSELEKPTGLAIGVLSRRSSKRLADMIEDRAYVFEKSDDVGVFIHVLAKHGFSYESAQHSEAQAMIDCYLADPDVVGVYAYVVENGNLKLVRRRTK